MGEGSVPVTVRIDVGPFDQVEDMHVVVDVMLAVFNAVPKEMGVPVETTIISEAADVDDDLLGG